MLAFEESYQTAKAECCRSLLCANVSYVIDSAKYAHPDFFRQLRGAKKDVNVMLCRIGDVELWRTFEIRAPFLTPEELRPNAGPDVRTVVE